MVWRALIEPEALARWCAPGAEMRARAGGLLRARVDRVNEIEAHIDVFDPPRRLRLIHLPSPSLPAGEAAVVDDFIVEPATAGSIVRLLGSGIPDQPEWNTHYLRQRTGWERALARLKVFVEQQQRQREAG